MRLARRSASQRGLTLAELLIALLVFSFVAATAVYALRLAVDAREQVSRAEERLAQLQIARLIVQEDLAQIVDRPVRDEFGEVAGPSFQGGRAILVRGASADETQLMRFVRGGWTNPLDASPRSTLQYVEYVARDGALVRRTRPYLDDARGQPVQERVLLENVGEPRVLFLAGEISGRLDWADGWPAGQSSGPPKAVMLTHGGARWGELTHLFWIGAIGAAAQASS
jgi:general secretion pathway protein J